MANLKWNNRTGWGCLFPFWLFWTVFIGIFDVVVIWGLAGQLWSHTFVAIQADLLERRIEESSGEDGNTYRPHVRYRYSVNGRQYESSRVRFSYVSDGNRARAEAELPPQQVGQPITVYYSTHSPATAVLHTGVEPMQLMLPLFLMPFNAVSLVGVLLVIELRLSRRLGRPYFGMRVRETGQAITEIRFYKVSPPVAIVVAAGAAGFALTFAVMMPPDRWLPLPVKLVTAWVLALLVVVIAWHWARRSGTALLLDPFRSTITYLPAAGAMEETIPVEQLAAVSKSEKLKIDADGDQLYSGEVKLLTKDGRSLPLTTQADEASADRLVRWLAERLKIEAKGLDSMKP
jgi:hypothetical protein